MSKKKNLATTSLAVALIFGGVGLLAGCGGKEDPTFADAYVTGEFADEVKQFVIGEEVSLEGAVITVSFSDESTSTVTVTDEMWDEKDYDFTTIGEKEITVIFKVNGENKTETIKIEIVNPVTVQEVIDMIDDLCVEDEPINSANAPEHLNSANQIISKYNALSAENKALVTNYDTLLPKYMNIKYLVLEKYVDLSLYDTDAKTTIEGYLDDAQEDIYAATDLAGVDAAVNAAEELIDSVQTTLEVKKANAKNALDNWLRTNYVSDDYSVDNWTLIQTEITRVKNEIDACTTVESVPAIGSEYTNSVIYNVQTIASSSVKTAIHELPSPTSITEYDEELATRVNNVRTAYNALSNDDKQRVGTNDAIYLESIEIKLWELDVAAYKATKVNSLNNVVSTQESNYSQTNWVYIEEIVETAVNDINNIPMDMGAVKLAIDQYYNEAMSAINGVATIKAEEVINMINALPNNWQYIDSANIVVVDNQGYALYNDAFVIGNTTYTIDTANNTVSDGTTTYQITDNKFEINETTYTIVREVANKITIAREKYTALNTLEKNNQISNTLKQKLENYNTVVYNKIGYKEPIINGYDIHLNRENYSNENNAIIDQALNALKYTPIFAETVDEFKTAFDVENAKLQETLRNTNTKLKDAQESVTTTLEEYVSNNNYYEEQASAIEKIISEAQTSANEVSLQLGQTMQDAADIVYEIIEDAKDQIDLIETIEELQTQKVEEKIALLKEHIKVEDYADLDSIEDLEEELTNDSADIVKAYQSAVTSLENCVDSVSSLEDIEGVYLDALESIDAVSHTYNITLSNEELNEMIDEIIAGETQSYYVEIGKVRDYIEYNGTKYDRLSGTLNNGSIINATVYMNKEDYEWRYGQTYENIKFENGKVYLSVPYLQFLGNTSTLKVSFGYVDGLNYNGHSTSDVYNITIEGLNAADENVKIENVAANDDSTGHNEIGEGSVAGYVSNSSMNILTSYKHEAEINFDYKNGENSALGNTVVQVKGHGKIYYYFVNLEEASKISIRPNGDQMGWAEEEISSGVKYYVSVYNENTGLDDKDLTFGYLESVHFYGVRNNYNDKLNNNYQNPKGYTEANKQIISDLVNQFSEKVNQTTNIQQLEEVWESDGIVGVVSDTTLTIEGNNYTVSGNDVLWFGTKVGTIGEGTVTLNSISLTIDGTDVKLNETVIGQYNSETNTISINDTEPQVSYYLNYDYQNVQLNYNSYLPTEVGTFNDDESVTGISLTEREFIVSHNSVINENNIGFTNRINALERVGIPTVKINDVVVECEEYEYESSYRGYYKYTFDDNESYAIIEITGLSLGKYSYLLNNEPIVESFAFYPGDYTLSVINNEDNMVIDEYSLHLEKESVINKITINGYEPKFEGNTWVIDRLKEKNSIEIDIKEGYTYEIYSWKTHENLTNLEDVQMLLGSNSFTAYVYKDEQYVDSYNLYIYVGQGLLGDLKFNDATADIEYGYVDVYGEGNTTEVTITSSLKDITSVDILDEDGNSLLVDGKLNVDNIPLVKGVLKIVADGITYYSPEALIVNTDDYIAGEIYEGYTDEDTFQYIEGIEECIEFKYDNKYDIPNGETDLRVYKENNLYVKSIIVPKGYDISKLAVSISSKYTGVTASVTFTEVSDNLLRLVVLDGESNVDTVMYYIVVENEDEIDDSASINGGALPIDEAVEIMNSAGSEKEALELAESKKTETTLLENVTSENPYYLEGINEYYKGNITVDVGDLFFIGRTNDYQNVVVTADFLMNMDEGSAFYFFFGEFETGDVVIIDVTSPDETKTVRYIYEIVKKDAMIKAEVEVTGNVSTPAVEFRTGTAMFTDGQVYGDFYSMPTQEEIYVAAIGAQEGLTEGDTVTLKLAVSSDIMTSGALTLDGNYDKDDESTYLSEEDLNGVEVTVQNIQELGALGIVFYAHQLDETGNEQEKITFILALTDGLNG